MGLAQGVWGHHDTVTDGQRGMEPQEEAVGG